MKDLFKRIWGVLWRTPIPDHLVRDGLTVAVGLLLCVVFVFTPVGIALIKAAIAVVGVALLLDIVASHYAEEEVKRQRRIFADFLYFALTDSRFTLHNMVQGLTNAEAIFEGQAVVKNLPPIVVQVEFLKTAPSAMTPEQNTLMLQTFLAAARTFWRERTGEHQCHPVIVRNITETRTTILVEIGFTRSRVMSPTVVPATSKPAPRQEMRHDKIRTFLRADLLEAGLLDEVPADLTLTPHVCLVGQTGSGKTTACKNLLSNILEDVPDATLWVLDFKNEDYKALRGSAHFFEDIACGDGLERFYNEVFLCRKRGETAARNRVVLLIEEYPSLLASLDKTQNQRVRTLVGNLLRLARAFNISVILTCQRADAALFENGARENIGIAVGMSALSDESKRMLFGDYLDEMRPLSGVGKGYIAITGVGLAEIEVQQPSDPAAVERLMRERCC